MAAVFLLCLLPFAVTLIGVLGDEIGDRRQRCAMIGWLCAVASVWAGALVFL